MLDAWVVAQIAIALLHPNRPCELTVCFYRALGTCHPESRLTNRSVHIPALPAAALKKLWRRASASAGAFYV